MRFLIQEILRGCAIPRQPVRIGFVLDVIPIPYSMIMASSRLRAYDVILAFMHDEKFFLELFKPWSSYDVVIFQKAFRDKHRKLAKKLKQSGTKIVLDININIFDADTRSPYTNTPFRKWAELFLPYTDKILTSSPFLQKHAQITYPDIPATLIEEHVPDVYFSAKKNVEKEPTTLIYAGYAVKAQEVHHLTHALQHLRKKHYFQLLFICEKNPHIQIPNIECHFERYRQERIHMQILKGDIFLAPRDLTLPYNMGHSFSKIGLPMAVGVPVIASPVPSYEHAPALFASTAAEWEDGLETLFNDTNTRTRLSRAGRTYCHNAYSTARIMSQYRDFFNKTLS